MIERSEAEIMKNWQGDITEPLVSVCCITYNHEKYISEAIDSFLMQETTFPFEIVIDEDCSTDNTAEIVKKYAEKYPTIIRANIRKENIGPTTNFIENMKRARGKYIALCEGDDYWTDALKLQKQADVIREYPNISLCFHSAKEINMTNNQIKIICKHHHKDTKLDIHNVFLGRGGYIPTASILFLNKDISKLAKIIANAPIGDFFVQAYMASIGDIYYINKPMCSYRRNAYGSWTESQENINARKKYNYDMVLALDNFGEIIEAEKHKYLIHKVTIHYALSYLNLCDNVLTKIYASFKLSFRLKNYCKIYFEARVLKNLLF